MSSLRNDHELYFKRFHLYRFYRSPISRLIPECRPDGKFASFQCHGAAVGGGKFYQCWDPEGNIIRGPLKKVKACGCILQRHQLTNERPRRIGAFIPACEESVHFKKHQCH
ncbi:U24-ctenitoxin-Pn1a-like [Panonychus citri]|uniref:U24-ctenitoxin-Pn1a-like n=1 Tax=Panonychus citri TaxID=50023 RepID=UPI0023080211|nr:U24-ctenitoxin-Pn1a-like [Panonychus citri]